MKRYASFMVIVATSLLLNGCIPRMPVREEPKVDTVSDIVTPDLPNGEVTYRTSLPYLTNQSKGEVATSNSRLDVSHRIDLNRIELGLLELAQTQFDPDKYLFQEGQIISSDDVEDWLGRYHAEKNRLGLNPENEANQLIHILEHDYLSLENKDLAGIVISLSVPSVFKTTEDKEEILTVNVQREKVKILASKVVERIRAKKIDVPILIAGYSLEPSSSIVPGHFINYGIAGKGDVNISGWETIDERYILYPGRTSTTENEKDLGAAFTDFQKELKKFFAQYAGVTGLTRFRYDEPVEMSITIRSNYSSKTEVIALIQFISGIIPNYFPEDMKLNIYVGSIDRPEAIYERPVRGEPFFHVYR